jgi:hypothetical protein
VIGAYLRRGLLAGLLAGPLAGLVGLAAGEPAVDAAVRLEERAAGAPAAAVDSPAEFTRGQQKAGLVLGTALVGLAAGALFALAAAWAVGRVAGDAWARSLKLGAAAAAGLVLLPALKYPPNPPAVGDPATIGTRGALYVGVVLLGGLLAATAWAASRQLAATRLAPPVRALLVAAGTLALAVALLAGLPAAEPAPAGFPAELLWRFRLGSIAVQLTLVAGLAAGLGLLTERSERAGRQARAGRAA